MQELLVDRQIPGLEFFQLTGFQLCPFGWFHVQSDVIEELHRKINSDPVLFPGFHREVIDWKVSFRFAGRRGDVVRAGRNQQSDSLSVRDLSNFLAIDVDVSFQSHTTELVNPIQMKDGGI